MSSRRGRRSSWNVNADTNRGGSQGMVGGKNKVFHLNNDSDYGGIRGTFSGIRWRDHVSPKVIQDDGAVVSIYLPISHWQWSTLNKCPLPMPKLVVHAPIHVYWKGQVTDSNLLNCARRYWCSVIPYKQEPRHCISPNTHSHLRSVLAYMSMERDRWVISIFCVMHEGVGVSVIPRRQGAAWLYLKKYLLPRAQNCSPSIYVYCKTVDRFRLAKRCVKVLMFLWFFVGTGSDAAVRFGPVQRAICLNLEPDLWFGSNRLLNLGLDLEVLVQQVRFGESIGSNLESQRFCITFAEKWCKYYIVNLSKSGMS